MIVEELKERKIRLEVDLEALLNRFFNDTSCMVSKVEATITTESLHSDGKSDSEDVLYYDTDIRLVI